MADVKELYSFVLLIVLVGMLIGVGVLVFDKMASTTSNKVLNFNTSITALNATTVTLGHGNITEVHSVKNASNQLTIGVANYTIHLENGTFELHETAEHTTCTICNLTFNNSAIEVVFDYKEYNTPTSNVLGAARTELSAIATDWLGLIVTVMILAIILFFVVKSFGPQAGRE